MKKLSIEEKAKAYDEALERARELATDLPNGRNDRVYNVWDLERIFPELKESDDERIRKAIIATIHLYYGEPLEDEAKEMIAWVERQGTPIDKVKPKFKVGDMIRNKWSNRIKTIIAIDNYQYTIDDEMSAQPIKVNIDKQDNWELVAQNISWSE